MKKLFLLAFSLAFALYSSCNFCCAAEGISFIYINGSNNNDKKMKNWYENGVKKLHPDMKKAFDQNPLSQKYFLRDGKYFINEDPVIFFWGDKSHEDLSFVEQNLEMSKSFSSWSAYQIRLALTKFLHDAIWVQKYHNMAPILDDLQKTVLAETQKGNKVVLYGYSAGSFVTYEYLLSKLPYLNVYDFFKKLEVSEETLDFIKQNPMKNTCMDAFPNSRIATLTATGHMIASTNFTAFKKNYMTLDDSTEKVCAPVGSVRGIVNFASPLVLFYSDLSDPNFDLTYYNSLLFEYILENDLFWITVNYRADPLGFPGGKNLTVEEMEQVTNLDIDPHLGFIYDQSNTWGRNSALATHTSYWATSKIFSKAVVKAYINGYKHLYDDYGREKAKHPVIKLPHRKRVIAP